jgi:hypothetical protein
MRAAAKLLEGTGTRSILGGYDNRAMQQRASRYAHRQRKQIGWTNRKRERRKRVARRRMRHWGRNAAAPPASSGGMSGGGPAAKPPPAPPVIGRRQQSGHGACNFRRLFLQTSFLMAGAPTAGSCNCDVSFATPTRGSST